MNTKGQEEHYLMSDLVKRVPRGFRVDGLDLLNSRCGCGGLSGPAGGIGDCCFTYSTVTRKNRTVAFFAKATSPHTTDNYEWGYRVKKGPVEVDVLVHDTRSFRDFPFGGMYPPLVSEWEKRGWKILSRFERPLKGIGGRLPLWCQDTGACEKTALGRRATHLDHHQKLH